LTGISFQQCSMEEVDFTRAELNQTSFEQCDLHRAIFDQSNLEKADFRTAARYSIDPENNYLKGARFSQLGLAGLLQKYNLEIE